MAEHGQWREWPMGTLSTSEGVEKARAQAYVDAAACGKVPQKVTFIPAVPRQLGEMPSIDCVGWYKEELV